MPDKNGAVIRGNVGELRSFVSKIDFFLLRREKKKTMQLFLRCANVNENGGFLTPRKCCCAFQRYFLVDYFFLLYVRRNSSTPRVNVWRKKGREDTIMIQ